MAGISRYTAALLGITAVYVLTATRVLPHWKEAAPGLVVTVERAETDQILWQSEDRETGGWPIALLPGEKIDLNRAEVWDLDRLPGVSRSMAEAIILWRKQRGPFQNLRQLKWIDGVDEELLERLSGYIVISP